MTNVLQQSQHRGWAVSLAGTAAQATPFMYEWSVERGSERYAGPSSCLSADLALKEARRVIDYLEDRAPNALFATSGRVAGEVDDTVLFIWARTTEQARDYFKAELLNDAEEDPARSVTIVSCAPVGVMQAGRFELDEALLPSAPAAAALLSAVA